MAKSWKNPLQIKGIVPGAYSEVTPFIFKDGLYLVENFKKREECPGMPATYKFHEDGFRIRNTEENRIISIPLLNHYFAIAHVWNDRVYIFAGDYEFDRPWWNIRRVNMISSDDLITWTSPQCVLRAQGDENIFNTAVCRGKDKFYMLYETDDKRWPKFTFRFCESDDLVNWRLIDDAIYGKVKYVGGPALYYQDGWFYCMYDIGDLEKGWDTQVARSKDLKTWHDAPSDRMVLEHDPEDWIDPSRFPDSKETSASDAELCEFRGKTILYWNGSDQEFCGNLKYGIYEGPASEYLASFFE